MADRESAPSKEPQSRPTEWKWRIVLAIAVVVAAAMLGALKYTPAPLLRTVLYVIAVIVLLTSISLVAIRLRKR